MSAKVIIIAAMSEDNAIGANNSLLWSIPEDLSHFKNKTLRHPIIMGRKTFESLGSKPLPNRQNIVITNDKNFQAKGVTVATSLSSAIRIAKKMDNDEIYIIGGGQVYKEAMDEADSIILTLVHKQFPKATVFFPKISSKKWKVLKEDEKQESRSGLKFTFIEYEKV